MAAKKRSTRSRAKKSDGHGFAIAALAAATAAGVYFLYGSDTAKKNRKQIKSWMLKAKGEVLEKMEKARELKKADYEKMVDSVTGKYKKLKSTNTKEVEDLARDLKKHWSQISKEAGARAAAKKRKKTAGKK